MGEQSEEHGEEAPVRGASPWLLALREESAGWKLPCLKEIVVADLPVGIYQGRQTAWVIARWPSGGGMALRSAYCPEGDFEIEAPEDADGGIGWRASGAIGDFRVHLQALDAPSPLIRCTVRLTPRGDLTMPFWPSDLYPMDANGDPMATRGVVHAGQRGSAAAIVYVSLTDPRSGSLLYLQNLTALNDYCEQLHVMSETRVGGSWPELGYTPPLAQRRYLERGREVVISEAFLCFSTQVPDGPHVSARLFLEMLSEIYRHLPRPEVVYHHWPDRAEATLDALEHSPECTRTLEGRRYLNAYVGTGDHRPESMVQLTALLAMLDYEEWRGEPIPLTGELREGLGLFYDHEIGAVLRYPESMREDPPENEDARGPWEVDSWYLYHPLVNLARLADIGHANAKRLLFDSLEYAIEVAHHFGYNWPVFFRADTLEMMEQGSEDGPPGETDVGGLYAYLMLRVWRITGDRRYLEEAKAAARKLEGLRFDLGYQFNNTAWGANACLQLWRETGDDLFLGISHICMAGIFHNSFLWECDYGFAKDYKTFLGLTPLRSGNYLALYEEYEVYAALHEYLTVAGDEIPDCLRILLSEACRYTLDRPWCYYPSELPDEALSTHPKNGHIDRTLAIPLEDIHDGWQQAGQIGQEVYGAGAPFAFVPRAYHRVQDAPFVLYCDYPITDLNPEAGRPRLGFRVRGASCCECRLRLIPSEAGSPLDAVVEFECEGKRSTRQGTRTAEGHHEYSLPGNSLVTLEWR